MVRLAAWIALSLVPALATAQDPDRLKWNWKPNQTFWVQSRTSVTQSFIIDDPPAVKFPVNFKPADEEQQRLVVLSRDARVRSLISHRVASIPAALAPASAGSLPALGLLAPYRLPYEREVKQAYQHTTFLRYTVKERKDSDGSAILIQRVEPGYSFLKDADGAVRKDPSLANAEVTLHVTARGVVTKVEGADKLLELVTANDSARREALREFLSEEALKASATQALGLFPDRPLKAGETWDRPGQLKLGSLGTIKLDRTFTLEGTRQRAGVPLASISSVSRVVGFEPPTGRGQAYQLAEAIWTFSDAQSTVDIDLNAGRPTEGSSSVTLAGFVTLRNADLFYRGRLTLSQQTTLQIVDRLPRLEDLMK